jgi:hypothetical protein
MHSLVEVSKQTHVRAVFADSVTFFDLPTHVTLEDLSERLSRLGEHHAGGLISLDVRTGSQAPGCHPRSARRKRNAMWCRIL